MDEAGATRARAGLGGIALCAVGIVHVLFGLYAFNGPLSEVLAAGVFNGVAPVAPTVGSDLPQALAPYYGRLAGVWFALAGACAVLLGALCVWIERSLGRAVPRFVGLSVVGCALLGIALMPLSGFYLLVPVGGYLTRRGARAQL